MNLKFLGACALLGACAIETSASSQTQLATAAPAAPAEVGSSPAQATVAPEQPVTIHCCKLAALTPVEFEILTPASSKTSKQGEQIRLRVAEPVSVDGKIVIPAGTEGFAEVIQVSRGAFGGKAGELVIGAPYLSLGEQRIGLKRFRYGSASGKDRAGQAIVATALVGIAGLLVSGGNIDIASGTRANAVITADTLVQPQP